MEQRKINKFLFYFILILDRMLTGGVDFQIRKWGLAGEVLFAYSHHHTSVRWLCMVRKEMHDTELQMWSSSNEPEIAQVSLLDDALKHDPLSDVKRGAGWCQLFL